MSTRKKPARSAAVGLLAAGAALITGGSEPRRAEAAPPQAPSQPQPEAPHGAMAMDRQMATIDRLLGQKVTSAPPRGVAPSFWRLLVPADNEINPERVALGKKLFFDPRLSRDGSVACATCHDVSRGFTDHRNASEGIGGQIGRRNAPTTLNAFFFETLFWDGRASSLENQAKLPILNPIEMGQPNEAAAVAGIAGDAEYQRAFRAAYGRGVNFDDLARAIAAFERTQVLLDAPFDRFVTGDKNAISDDAKAGWALFNGKGRCTGCHWMSSSAPVGTDNRFHNVGVSARHQDFEGLVKRAFAALAQDSSQTSIDRLALQTDLSELGRFVVTRNRDDVGGFKTPLVRNVGVTAPYMHDGSMQTLWDVMDHYNKGGEANAFLDGGMEPLDLSEQEIDQMVAFLFSLTDFRLAEQNESERQRQRALANKQRPFRDDALAHRKVLLFERRAVHGQGEKKGGTP